VQIINGGTYPYPLQFFPHEVLPNHRIFNYVEVVNVQPDGTIENADVTRETNIFEVRILVRYNQFLELETDDLANTEKEILTLLESATLGDKKIVLESKQWNRSEIRNNPNKVHGRQSVLTVRIEEVKSTSGLGNIGGESTITIGSLTDIPFLDKPAERETEINENVYNTARQRKALSPITDTHSFLGEIENTKTRIDELRTLKRARAVISGITYKRPGVADEVFTGKVVEISNGAPFNNIETIVFQIERLT
jgi:hypothetical protein